VFDAHQNDPLAGINLEADDFTIMTKCCLEIQPNLLLGLEGGYDLEALGQCCVGVCEELM
jgi:acetoin utilization deacetylase AcuC-like enzyme